MSHNNVFFTLFNVAWQIAVFAVLSLSGMWMNHLSDYNICFIKLGYTVLFMPSDVPSSLYRDF